MPGFDWDHCIGSIAPNAGVTNPEGFCAWLEHEQTGAWPAEKARAAKGQAFAKRLSARQIRKVEESRGLVFGFASVAVDASGLPIVDYQGDLIEPATLEDAAYGFVLKRHGDGAGGELHEEAAPAGLVESMAWTPDKTAAFFGGTDPILDLGVLAALKTAVTPDAAIAVLAKAIGTRWWIGQKVPASTLAKVKAGALPMFSIQGTAVEEEIGADQVA